MAKKNTGKKIKINESRLIKTGAVVVFAAFAGILLYVSMFIWNTLSNIGDGTDVTDGTRVQGINNELLNDIEGKFRKESQANQPDNEIIRNPFMPIGQQRPLPTVEEDIPSIQDSEPSTVADANKTEIPADKPDLPTPPPKNTAPNQP